MELISPVFGNNGMIPKKYTCQGLGVNPPLRITHPPHNAQSFAILMHDPDAPNGDFVHWILWNISPEVQDIAEGTSPIGSREGIHGAGQRGWVAPCPPIGMHHYEFHLYALDTMLDIPELSTRSTFLNALQGHVLEETVLVGLYEKDNT